MRDNAAFKSLYEASIRYVYSIVKRYVTNNSDHPDVIQEIYARVFLSVNTYDPAKGDFKSWLRRVTINQCAMHYRQGKSPRLVVSLDGVNEVDESVERKLNQLSTQEVESIITDMPDGYKQVLMLVVMDEYTHKEVAELLDITAETSRSQLSRAKGWLRKHVFSQTDQKFLTIGNQG